jgi:hypothetical protein
VANVLDPNEKVGPAGMGEARYVRADAPLTYVIYFENVPTATASVQEINITDLLDTSKLDLDTFQFGPAAFGATVAPLSGHASAGVDVDLRPAQDLIVRVTADLDKLTGEVTWHFVGLDPDTMLLTDDPEAGFLPPNTDGSGQGSVVFTVWPKAGLASGTQLSNAAEIVFELNPPIVTAPWSNTFDSDAPASAVQALPPAQSGTSFTVAWAGTDGGAGIRDYTVYVSRDSGAYEPWLVGTTLTSATFTAPSSGTYAFYSVARDAVGHIEPPPGSPDATTQVAVGYHLHLPFVLR